MITNTNTGSKLELALAPNPRYSIVAPSAVVERTAEALTKNGMQAFVVADGTHAKDKVLELVPHGAHVFTTISRTLEVTGISAALNDSGNYGSIRKLVMPMNRDTEMREIRKLQSAHDFVVGSVHAVTQDGIVVVGSGSGSQIPSYAYGGDRVIWVVGAQKIVPDLAEGLKRLQEYCLPLESERMQALYGRNSSLNKILIVQKERPGRITVILVQEQLGF